MEGILVLVVFGIALVAIGLISRHQRAQRYRDALAPTCVICEAPVLDEPDYRCDGCGYHNRLARDPSSRSLVDAYRNAKHALNTLDDAVHILTFLPSEPDKRETALRRAQRLGMEAMDLLQEVMRLQPDLLSGAPELANDHGLAEVQHLRDEVEKLQGSLRQLIVAAA